MPATTCTPQKHVTHAQSLRLEMTSGQDRFDGVSCAGTACVAHVVLEGTVLEGSKSCT